jgi:23S rRNA (adenine2503-C2)-methyltransferase
MTTLPSVVDFRDRHPSEMDSLFQEHGFNTRRILNFKKAFREQHVDRLQDLKGVRGLEPLIPHLPLQQLCVEQVLTDVHGNQKFLFRTVDGLLIESVLMPAKHPLSVCISVQAGCRFGCRFCNTGRHGFARNLLPHEMLDQVRHIFLGGVFPRTLGCVTFMGMGDPFDNIENCRIAFDWMRSDWGWCIGSKKITFSTLGAVGWDAFFSLPTLPNLAVSLHSAVEEKRDRLMPRSTLSLSELKSRMMRFTERTNKQVSIEYCLFRGVNDSREDAKTLARYLRGLPCKINLMNYNPLKKDDFQPVAPEGLLRFKSWMSEAGFPVLHRKSIGVDIGAGCGQLGASLMAPCQACEGLHPAPI